MPATGSNACDDNDDEDDCARTLVDDGGNAREISIVGERVFIALTPSTAVCAPKLSISTTASAISTHEKWGSHPLVFAGWMRDATHNAGPGMLHPLPSSPPSPRDLAGAIDAPGDLRNLVLRVTLPIRLARHLDIWIRIRDHVVQLGFSGEGAAHWLKPSRLVELHWLVSVSDPRASTNTVRCG